MDDVDSFDSTYDIMKQYWTILIIPFTWVNLTIWIKGTNWIKLIWMKNLQIDEGLYGHVNDIRWHG
jgi:hypothetical protein